MAPLAEAFLRLRPSTAGFQKETERQIGKITIPVAVRADTSKFRDDVRTKLAKLPAVKVRVTPDVTGFSTELRAKLRDVPKISIKVDNKNALKSVAAVNTALKTVNTTLHLDLNTQAAAADLANFSAAIKSAANTINLDFDTAAATAKIAALKAALKAMSSTSVRVQVHFPTATSTGTRIGRAAARAFAKAFRQALASMPPTRAPGPTRAQSTADGAESGGAYASGFRAAVIAATRDLPTPTIGAATGPAEQKIRDLRLDLERLSNQRVGVDVDAATAMAELRRVEAELHGIAATSANVQIQVDATRAQAQLARFREQLARLGPNAAQSAQRGAESGGAFGAAFRRGVESATRSLRPVNITANTDDVTRDVELVRVSLESLANRRIGVDIDAATALAEVQRLQGELRRLGASSADIQVRADTAAAAARLAEIRYQVERLARTRGEARVDVDTAAAQGRIGMLVTAIATIGPAAVPAAAAASGAIAAIGVAAVSAAAAVGVAVAAFRGVVDAVKALNKAHSEAAKSAAQQARENKTLAGGADQVRTALAALANARASAADGARRAAQQISDAERGLVAAQRDALRAQQDLTRAREEARRAAEDLASQVAGNSLDIRQANLDLADAKRELDAVLANPAASRRQREEAQLTYDRAVQQLADLTTRQERLAEEQAAAAKAGVDGSEQVTAAQDRIADSQQRVRDAERAVTEARLSAAEQARQSAYSIAQAQQAVVAAQRSVATSAVTTASTAGAALDDLAEKMDALGPRGREFAQFLVSLGPIAKRFKTEAEGMFPGIEAGIRAVLGHEQALVRFTGRVADGMGAIAERQLKAFASDEWRPFFSYINATAVPTLDRLARSFGNVALGVANMLVGFGQATTQVNGGLLRMTERFAAWSATLERNQQFQRFIDYVTLRGPQVVATLGDLVDGFLAIAEAAAPVGDVTLAVLRGIGQLLDAIPTPVLTALVAGFAALRIAGLVAPAVIALGTAIRGVATGAVTARVAATGLGTALGGPVAIGLAAATLLLGAFVQKTAESKAKVDRLKGSLDNYADTLRQGFTTESVAAAQVMLRQDAALRGLVTTIEQAGLSQETLVAGLNGDRQARETIVKALDAQIAAEEHLRRVARQGADHDTAAATAHRKRAEELQRMKSAFEGVNTANQAANDLTAALRREYERLPAAQRALIDMYKVLNDATATAAQRSDALRTAYDNLFGAAISQTEAAEAYARATMDLTRTVNDNISANGALGRSLDMNTAEGLRNRDAIQARLKASVDMYLADVRAGVSVEEATRRHEDRTKALVDEAAKAGLNSAEVRKLIDIYGQVPSDVKTQVRVLGIDEAMAELTKLRILQLTLQGLPFDRAVKEVRKQFGPNGGGTNGDYTGVGGYAAGGLVTGPGGPTEDKVPAYLPTPAGPRPIRLSDGEWITRTAAVDYYGPAAMAAINNMSIPREALTGAVLRRAQGGPVVWPFDVDTTRTRIPSMEEVRAAVEGSGATGGGVEDIKAFIRRADALPYVFGAAGPQAYDCCLPGRTMIHGPAGPKRIDEIVAGDKVYSRADDGALVERKVVKAWRSIDQQTFRLKVRGRNIDASANHPFLRVTSERVTTTGGPCRTDNCGRPARGRGLCGTCYARLRRHGQLPGRYQPVVRYDLEWVRLDQLRRDDTIVVLDHTPDPNAGVAPELPDDTPVTGRVAWLLGAIVGDGTVTARSIRLAAFGEFADDAQNAFAEAFGLTAYPHPSAGLIVNSTRTAGMLSSLGYWRRGADKRVPEMVWSWPRELQMAFCAGYAAADGHQGRDGLSYSSCSRRLIDEVRTLHVEAGHRVTNVTVNRRVKPIIIKGKRVVSAKPLYSFTVSSYEPEPYAGMLVGGQAAAVHALTGGPFGLRRVLGVEPLGVEPTYDLNIDEHHNFVADGVVVHNSGLTGAVYGLIRGLSGAGQGRRYFTTHNFAGTPPAGFKPGVGGVYSVGVNPQSHMAGEYGGLRFEAASSRSGIKVGPSARSVQSFQKQFHLAATSGSGGRALALAAGGLVDANLATRLGLDVGGDPSGLTINGRRLGGFKTRLFDTGGAWPTNTIGINTSGRTEQVTTADGMERVETLLERLIAAVERVAPGVGRELRGVSRQTRAAARTR